jgi:hypothetical protein
MTANALDLTRQFPRSPRKTLAGCVVAARMLDKCRAVIAGTNGDYHFDCPLDNTFLEFTGIRADAFRNFVAAGADDTAVAAWINENARPHTRREIIGWNNSMRDRRISEMPIELQEFLESYIPEHIPPGKIVRVWFDVYDFEEGRL